MEYPKTLREKDWQKHKGILAKIIKDSKVSGIGEKLTACESAFKALGDKQLQLPKDSTEKAKAWPTLCANEGKALLDALEAVATLAEQKAADWGQKTSPVPKSTVTAVDNVAKAARGFITTAKQSMIDTQKKLNETAESERLVRAKQLEVLVDTFKENLKSAYDDSKDAARKVTESLVKEKDVAITKDLYDKLFGASKGEIGRRLATALRTVQMARQGGVEVEDPQPIMKALVPWSTGNLMSAPASAEAIMDSVQKFAEQLKKVSAAYKAYIK